MGIVMIPKMFNKNQDEILEKVCDLFLKLKVEDPYYKCELALQMRCVIHKYAKTIDDITRLEEVIGLQQAMSAMEYQKQQLIKQGIDQGINQGIEQGSFDMALKVKRKYGIEEAIAMSSFSREELENEKLNGR